MQQFRTISIKKSPETQKCPVPLRTPPPLGSFQLSITRRSLWSCFASKARLFVTFKSRADRHTHRSFLSRARVSNAHPSAL